jgi:hypothetical protein
VRRTNRGTSLPHPGTGNDDNEPHMSLDPGLLFLSLITSGIGFVLFVYGKKQSRFPQLLAGIALMVYPYFTPTMTSTIAVAVAIIAALWLAVRQGY